MISSPIFLFNLPVHVNSHHTILILYYYVSVYIFKLILVCFQLTFDNYADIYHHVARRTGSTALSIVHYKQPCRRKGLCCHLCRADSSKCLADQCSQHAPYVSGLRVGFWRQSRPSAHSTSECITNVSSKCDQCSVLSACSLGGSIPAGLRPGLWLQRLLGGHCAECLFLQVRRLGHAADPVDFGFLEFPKCRRSLHPRRSLL